MLRLQVAKKVVRVKVADKEVDVDIVPIFTCSYQIGSRDKLAYQVIIPVEL